MRRKPASSPNHSPGEHRRVLLRHEKTEAHHARGLRDLVGLELGTRQGEPFDSMRIDFELSCGEAWLNRAGVDYRLSLRSCFVVIERENCELMVHSRYEHRLSEGSIESTSSSATSTERSRGVGGSIKAEARAASKPFLGGVFSLGLDRQKKASEQEQNKRKRHDRVDLITTAGHDRWRVGDPILGDPRNPNHLLAGSYFGESRSADGEALPFCILSGKASGFATLTASVTAIVGQVLVFKDGAPSSMQEAPGLELTLRRRSSSLGKEHAKHKAAVRAAIAGLVAANALKGAQIATELALSATEFAIARQTIALQASDQVVEVGA